MYSALVSRYAAKNQAVVPSYSLARHVFDNCEGALMADRTLRGSRIGSTSLQGEAGVELAPRRQVEYVTDKGTTFSVVFEADAEPPAEWVDHKSGQIGFLDDEAGRAARAEIAAKEAAARTPWDMLIERRTIEELEELLEERLQALRARRGTK